MNILKKTNRLGLALIVSFVASMIFSNIVSATGISIDAGLTPAENRWMLRSQVRYMHRDNDPSPMMREMKMHMFPVVVAYGLRPDLTVMVRQAIMRSEMAMMSQSSPVVGFADLLVLAKYRLARVNTSTYTLGVAPTLGLEIPSGKENFSSNSYDLRMGCFVSGRLRSLGIDLNATYIWNGMVLTGD